MKNAAKQEKVCCICSKKIETSTWAERRNKAYCWPCADEIARKEREQEQGQEHGKSN